MITATSAPSTVIPIGRYKVAVPPGSVYVSTVPVQGGQFVWTCCMCGKNGFWGPDWSSYGSILLEDEGIAAPLCSDPCRKSYEVLLRGPRPINTAGYAEPKGAP